MKKLTFTAFAALFSCVLLSGCVSDSLRTEQKTERQAMADKLQADRQVERAQKEVASSALALEASQANLAAKKKKQADADAALQQVLNPEPAPVTK